MEQHRPLVGRGRSTDGIRNHCFDADPCLLECGQHGLDGILANAGDRCAVVGVCLADDEVKFLYVFSQLLFQGIGNCAQHFLTVAGRQPDMVQVHVGAVKQHNGFMLLCNRRSFIQGPGCDPAGELTLGINMRPGGLVGYGRVIVDQQGVSHQ